MNLASVRQVRGQDEKLQKEVQMHMDQVQSMFIRKENYR